ncbi:hypothetical protein B0H13DRAFT_2040098, partial [Mycena leptocephala]
MSRLKVHIALLTLTLLSRPKTHCATGGYSRSEFVCLPPDSTHDSSKNTESFGSDPDDITSSHLRFRNHTCATASEINDPTYPSLRFCNTSPESTRRAEIWSWSPDTKFSL